VGKFKKGGRGAGELELPVKKSNEDYLGTSVERKKNLSSRILANIQRIVSQESIGKKDEIESNSGDQGKEWEQKKTKEGGKDFIRGQRLFARGATKTGGGKIPGGSVDEELLRVDWKLLKGNEGKGIVLKRGAGEGEHPRKKPEMELRL